MVVSEQNLVPPDQSPVLLAIGAGLARHNQMLSVIFSRFATLITHDLDAIRMILVLSIQGCSSGGAVIQRGWLLVGVVSEAVGNQFDAVCDAEVETVGYHLLGTDELDLKVYDCCDCIVES